MRGKTAVLLALAMFAIGSVFTYALSESNIRMASGDRQGDFLAPQGDLSPDHIKVYDNRVEIVSQDKKFVRSVLGPTRSMRPVGGAGTTIIESEFNIEDWKDNDKWRNLKGRFVSFTQDSINYLHQVVETGVDEEGRYLITQGTNNLEPDNVRVRENMIIGVVEAVVYSG